MSVITLRRATIAVAVRLLERWELTALAGGALVLFVTAFSAEPRTDLARPGTVLLGAGPESRPTPLTLPTPAEPELLQIDAAAGARPQPVVQLIVPPGARPAPATAIASDTPRAPPRGPISST